MNSADPVARDKLTRGVRTDAAAWLARLHGPNRNAQTERGFRRWLQADGAHAAAFEMVTEVWDKAGRIRRPAYSALAPAVGRTRFGFAMAGAAMVACTVLVSVLVTMQLLRKDVTSTGVGEQRIITLDDGSRMFLNTATRIDVRYDSHERRVLLLEGEALFEVAREPSRPFVVDAGERQVLALGTSFLVRRSDAVLAVTLVDGSIEVAPVGQSVAADAASAAAGEGRRISVPGQRLTFAVGQAVDQAPQLDSPSLEKITAWRQGQVAFDDVPLADAVAEMNRYSKVRLELQDPQATDIRISGIFRAGDAANFARALAATYELRVTAGGKRIVLDTAPQASAPPEQF